MTKNFTICLSSFQLIIVALSIMSGNSLKAAPKVMIITHGYNRPDFIEIQYKTFKKFLKDNYEYIVFNDGPTPSQAQEIEDICTKLGIRCFRIPQEIHSRPYMYRDPREEVNSYNTPSVRCSNAVQYSLDILGFDHDGIVAIVDSDMFLIQEFSIVNYLKDYDIASVSRKVGNPQIEHIWVGIMFLNMNTLPNKRTLNFNCGFIGDTPVDAGGYNYYYLVQNPGIKVRFMRDQYDIANDTYILNSYEPQGARYTTKTEVLEAIKSNKHLVKLIEQGPDDIQLFIKGTFLHYRRGSNYINRPPAYHKQKTQIINSFLDSILSEK